jgi:ATP-dependent Lhr-like helicase
VIQIDSAHSIASLIQRVGRSGRREGLTSNLLLYTTDKWHLLQSFSCWELFQTGFVEPVYGQSKPFDLLFHQVLSIVKENCGIPGIDLVQRITGNAAFASIESIEVDRLLQYMIENDFLEDLKRELIVGYEGEKLTNSREFYSVFSTPAVFKVIHSGKGIGEIPLTTSVVVNQNIYLAAKIWQITDVDLKSLKILVVPANDGKKPLFLGEGGDVHPSIREKMLELLYSTQSPENANEAARDSLTELRKQFRHISIEELKYDRPYIVKEDGIVLYTFTGTRINRTIQFLLKEAGIEAVWEELDSSFRIKRLVFTVEEILSKIKQELSTIENSIHDQMVVAPDSFQVSKWAVYLPLDLKKKYVLANNFDIFGTMTLLNNIRWLKGENVAHDSKEDE